MTEEQNLIELPAAAEIKEILTIAKKDIAAEVKENDELKIPAEFLVRVIGILEEKVNKGDISKFSEKERIDLAAHLSFLHSLLEDFFFDEDEFFDDEEFDELEEDEEEDDR